MQRSLRMRLMLGFLLLSLLTWGRAARPVLVDPFLSVAREHPTGRKLSI